MAIVDRSTEHAHPRLDITCTVADRFVSNQLFEVAIREVLDDHVDVLVLGGEHVEQGDNARMRDLLKVLDLTDRVDIQPFSLLRRINFEFLDRNKFGWIGSQMSLVDDGISAFT